MPNQEHFIRSATALWEGDLKTGVGNLSLQSLAFKNQPYSYRARFEEAEEPSTTNPEELIAAAHASCFAMQLSHYLSSDGHPPSSIEVCSEVRLNKEASGFKVTSSLLLVTAKVPGMEKEKVLEWAEKAKLNCPISKALGAITIGLELHVPS